MSRYTWSESLEKDELLVYLNVLQRLQQKARRRYHRRPFLTLIGLVEIVGKSDTLLHNAKIPASCFVGIVVELTHGQLNAAASWDHTAQGGTVMTENHHHGLKNQGKLTLGPRWQMSLQRTVR